MYTSLTIVFVYTCVTLFGLFAICTTINVAYVWCRSKAELTYVKIVLTLIPITALSRAIWAANLPLDQLQQPLLEQNVYAMVFGGLVGYLFFSVYCSVGLIWVILVHKIRAKKSMVQSLVTKFMLVTNIVVYLIYILLLVGYFTAPSVEEKKIWHTAEAVYHASLNLIAAAVSGIYGLTIYKILAEMQKIRSHNEVLTFKVGLLSAICTTILIAQGVEILLATFVLSSAVNAVLTVIYVVVEGVSELLVVLIFSIKDQEEERYPLVT